MLGASSGFPCCCITAAAGRALFGGRRSLHSGFNGVDGPLFAAGALAFKGVAAFGKPTSTTEARRHGEKQSRKAWHQVIHGKPHGSPGQAGQVG